MIIDQKYRLKPIQRKSLRLVRLVTYRYISDAHFQDYCFRLTFSGSVVKCRKFMHVLTLHKA